MKTHTDARMLVLGVLERNGRASLRSVAKEVGLSTTTVSKIVQELEEEGIITGYGAQVNWPKLGYAGTICLHVGTAPGADIDAVGTRIRGLTPILTVFYTTGETTFMAYAACRTMEDANVLIGTIQDIPGVERIVPHAVLRMY